MKSRKFRKMNKNKSRKNRVTHKRKNHKKINRTRKGGMPKEKRPEKKSAKSSTIPLKSVQVISIPSSQVAATRTPVSKNNTVTRLRVDFNENGLNINGNSPSQTKKVTLLSRFLSWFDILSDDTPDTPNVITLNDAISANTLRTENTPETPPTASEVSYKETTIGVRVTFKGTPNTEAVIVGTSLVDFAGIITNYLNEKIKSLPIEKRPQVMGRSQSVNNNNYYNTFLRYLQHVKGFKIYGTNPSHDNKLNEYFKAALSNNTFDRKYFFKFVKEILPQFKDQLDKVRLRIDYTGVPLAKSTQQQTGTQGEIYIPYFEKNKKSGVLCNDEKTWVFECIKNRNNNYISTYDGKNKWITLGKKTTPTLENKIKNINSNMSHYNLKKKPCGQCWICNQKIYHYYIYRGTQDIPENRIYLNTKCGEDEHVFPPTIGDIIGTLNMDSDLTRQTIDQYGIHTLLSYGIRPSHAFCNQMKSDFLLYALMNLGTGTVPNIHNYIETKWKATVLHWFQKGRHHSLENIKGFFQTMPQNPVNFANVSGDIINSETTGTSTSMVNTSNTSSGRNIEANNYYEFTLQNMKDYLNTNIAPRILQQATLGQSDVGNMLKLKMLIYIIQIGKNIIGKPFLDQWDQN